MATLKDIAKITGLTATTVSRALRGFDDVSPATRTRVREVARELNYRPNHSARKLVSGRSGIVGLVLDTAPADFESPHFFEIAHSITQAMAGRGLDLMLHISTDADPLQTYDRLIGQGVFDGFVLLFPRADDARMAFLSSRDVPFVVHGKHVPDPDYPFFDLDTADIVRRAVAHLAAFGHRRIALLNGEAGWQVSRERAEVFADALMRAGLHPVPELICYGDTSRAYGRDATRTLIAIPDRPTGIVCCNSLVAGGVLDAAGEAGLSIPGDLSVVAHDDVLPGMETGDLNPPLTVTRRALRDAGTPLADLMQRRLNGEPVRNLQVLETAEWIGRASVAPAPAGG
ncbi:transcriptional regulator [Sagittula sp. P11]|uniref:LacI family DNA-binding transcriptional regulator n=1 Tax=Sagittula sp. P11 TaxID=2009329 RepID=UPI000C2CE569|nr:LacI family DNA-binding transcriptional regulator [Sagittula sp. P11]AUC53938.1 transcriptional regulator [Sagittula sp. P11]